MAVFLLTAIALAFIADANAGNIDIANPPIPVDKCLLKPVTGLCRAAFKKWYYDSTTRTCKEFIYGGCGGNDNRFDSENECLNECHPCDSFPQCPSTSGVTCAALWSCWYYNTGKRECEFISFGGCGVCGKNCYQTKQKCMDVCLKDATERCSLPAKSGICLAYFPSWYYDSKAKKCKKFVYGGCGGNENRFKTKRECEKMCKDCSGHKPRPCDPDDKPNTCGTNVTPWYYDMMTKKCIKGKPVKACTNICSKNFYLSEKECEKKCETKCIWKKKWVTTVCDANGSNCITGTCKEILDQNAALFEAACKDKKSKVGKKCCKLCKKKGYL